MATPSLREALARIAGPEALASAEQLPLYSVDGVVPEAAVAPRSVEQVLSVVRLAAESRSAIVPRGGGTVIGAGMPPERHDIALETRSLDKLIFHEPADLVACAEAGMTLETLNKELAKHGQMLPLDVPNPGRATLGGVLAANTSGPRRGGYGTARDRVIGLKVVDPSGTLVKGGGRVVKNVAGYDLPKLFIGAHGTLGVIVETALKLSPLPAKTATVVGAFGKVGQALEAGLAVLDKGLRPQALSLLNGTAYRLGAKHAQMPSISDRDYFLAVEVTGVLPVVERQQTTVQRTITEAGGKAVIADDSIQQEGFWRAIVDTGRTAQHPATMITRFACRWEAIEKLVLGHEAQAESNGFEAAIEVYLGVGVGRSAWWADQRGEPDEVKLAAIVGILRKAGEISGGPFVVEVAPVGVKERVDVWGPAGGGFEVMRRLKASLDPDEIMSPGRFLGGL